MARIDVEPRPSLGRHIAFSDGIARHVIGEATDFHFRSPQHIVSLALRGHRNAELRLSSDVTRRYDVAPNTVHLIEADVEIWKTWPGSYELSGFLLDADAVERATNEPFRLRTALDLDEPTIAALLRLLSEDMATGSPRGRLYLEGVSAALAAHLAAFHRQDGGGLRLHQGGLGVSRLRKFKEAVRANLHDPDLSLETLASAVGHHRFNTRDHKTKTPKPESEHAVMEVPPIVSEAEFEAVQRSLKARSPKMMAPMAVGGPTLLTGICFCACCGGAMTLRTGTSSVGREYRYYTCSTKARQGATGCPGITVPMDRLNQAVVDHLEARLLDPARLEALMDQILERRDEWVNQRREHVADLERREPPRESRRHPGFSHAAIAVGSCAA